MSSVLVDTSSLLFLRQFLRINPSEKLKNVFNNPYFRDTIQTALEAFILYDDIYVDKQSYTYNLQRLGDVFLFDPFLKKIYLTEEEEKSLYDNICFKYADLFIEERPGVTYENYSSLEHLLYTERTYLRDFDTEEMLNHQSSYGAYENMVMKMRPILSQTDLLKEQHVQVYRCLYYLELQKISSTDLIIDPKKKGLMDKWSHFLIQKTSPGTAILNKFDETRTKRIEKLKEDYLGQQVFHSVPIPMLSQYVLEKCDQDPNAIYETILEVRNSSKAVRFRKGLNELTSAIKNNDKKTIDEVLYALDHANEEWNKSLNYNPSLKKLNISLSLPYTPFGTDIDIPYTSRNESTANKLLVFVHELMKNNYK